jgi:putative long chain acyl-CoA synthase
VSEHEGEGRRSGRALGRRALAGARNALELFRLGKLATEERRGYVVVAEQRHAIIRRYVLQGGVVPVAPSPAVLLVPPLMLTAEIYDVSPDSTGVGVLLDAGIAPYVIDFGAPERSQGGMRRTLDDHVLAVSDAIDLVRRENGRDVHLAGYSQGGMFAYQAAAFRRSEGLASIVTFGSPVDLHRSLPGVRSEAVDVVAGAIAPAVSRMLDRIEGLPAELTSVGFKLITPRKELQQRLDFVRKLHDRGALERREARRRFLGGEGFVAWPGPALRDFVEQFILQNRMLEGGFVVDGRSVTLADITCPVLAFIGRDDDMARPAAVRGIVRAAPSAEVSFVELRAGHFGLVVGSRATRETWPTVAAWVRYRDGEGPAPDALDGGPASVGPRSSGAGALNEIELEANLLRDAATAVAQRSWERLGDIATSASDTARTLRYQLPVYRRLQALQPSSAVSPSRALAQWAKRAPQQTFFLWQGRAFSFGAADRRVDAVARGLVASGVRPGDRVGVHMSTRPSFLSVVTALSRIGAVAVVAPSEVDARVVARGFADTGVAHLVADPVRAEALRGASARTVLVLGGARGRRVAAPGLIDMEAIDPTPVEWPRGMQPDSGVARDLALILLRSPRSGVDDVGGGALLPVPLTNHRWALSAMGAAGACALGPDDTVHTCLPLHHPTSLVVAIGAALVAGCRLAIGVTSPGALFAPGSDAAARDLLGEIRRVGATVVFYAGDLLTGLLRAPPSPADRSISVRLFAGSGVRAATSEAVAERFDAGVMEFYAATAQRLVVANPSRERDSALGRPLPGSAPIALARLAEQGIELERDNRGRLVEAAEDQQGLLLVRADQREVAVRSALGVAVIRDAFDPGDAWEPTLDVLRRDGAGELWFVGGLTDRVRDDHLGRTWAREVEDALEGDPRVERAVAFSDAPSSQIGAAVVARRGESPDIVAIIAAKLPPRLRPRFVRVTDRLPMNEGFRPSRATLAALGDAARGDDVVIPILD